MAADPARVNRKGVEEASVAASEADELDARWRQHSQPLLVMAMFQERLTVDVRPRVLLALPASRADRKA